MEAVGDYEYSKKDLIGHGAFAVVFKGRSRKNPSHTVAIKSITKKNLAKSQNLLSKEIKILKELSDLHHENVVALLDCKETTNHVYLVMEYCNGGDLADYLQAKGTLSEDTISLFLRHIAAAMKALNAKGIVHRDLKPQNILLCTPGKSNAQASEIKLKIADFGFARFLQDGVMAATLCGSPMYMAPEVIMSLQYDAKADLWSIGTIVFQCLTGKAPFQAQTPQQLKHFYEKHSELKPNIPKDTSADLKDLLTRMLKRNAKDRIDFESFFTHPFLKPPSPSSASSPVPVPGRLSNQGFSSESPTPPRCVSASPLSGKVDYSPPPPHKTIQAVKKEETEPMQASSQENGEFLKIEKDCQTPGNNSPTEDFVLVPEGLQCEPEVFDKGSKPQPMEEKSDTPPQSLNTVTASPNSGVVAFKKPSDGQTSPNRPSTLPMQIPAPSSQTSEPIPVPSQVKAYQRIQSSVSPSHSPKKMDVSPVESVKDQQKKEIQASPQSAENRFSGPDIGSMSPPSVKFSIGTPPSGAGQWRRGSIGTSPGRYGNTPPSLNGSPHRRSGSGSPIFPSMPFAGPGSLPAIMGSPTKFCLGLESRSPDSMPSEPVHAPFGASRPRTVPDNMAALQYGNGAAEIRRNLFQHSRAQTEPNVYGQLEGGSLLSQQMVKAAFGSQQSFNQLPGTSGGTVVPYSSGWAGSKERLSSPSSEKPMSIDNETSSGYFRHRTPSESSPPPSLMYAQSPPNMEGPIAFVAPELCEETLMDDEHNETLAKLSFVNDLVECIMELAQTKGAAIQTFTDSVSCKQGENLPSEQVPKYTEAQRRLEQMVLYVRTLHLLSSSLQLAKKKIKDSQLQISNSLKNVLKQMNDNYHQCVTACKQIQQRMGVALQSALTPHVVVSTADKLIYNHAIEMCQTAALDELFGNPNECFRRYQTAHILLHSLTSQARNSQDKELLVKYKAAVERRLTNIQTTQTYVHQWENVS